MRRRRCITAPARPDRARGVVAQQTGPHPIQASLPSNPRSLRRVGSPCGHPAQRCCAPPRRPLQAVAWYRQTAKVIVSRSDHRIALQAGQQALRHRMADRLALAQLDPGVEADAEVALDHFGLLAMDHRAHLGDNRGLDVDQFLNAPGPSSSACCTAMITAGGAVSPYASQRMPGAIVWRYGKRLARSGR